MRGVNHVVLMGYVGTKPKGMQFPNGGVTTSFRLSTKDAWFDENTGQQREETEWHNIVGHGNFAVLANTRLEVGALIMIHGSVHTRSWEDQSGSKNYKTEIVMNFLEMLEHGHRENNYVTNNPPLLPNRTQYQRQLQSQRRANYPQYNNQKIKEHSYNNQSQPQHQQNYHQDQKHRSYNQNDNFQFQESYNRGKSSPQRVQNSNQPKPYQPEPAEQNSRQFHSNYSSKGYNKNNSNR